MLLVGILMMAFEPSPGSPEIHAHLCNLAGALLALGSALLNYVVDRVRLNLEAEALFNPIRVRTDRVFRKHLRFWGLNPFHPRV
jgi:hypothetical protein